MKINGFIDSKEVKITIAENGIGIDPTVQGKIFDMFYRLHSREEYDGTGLGLAITKKLVKQIKMTLKSSQHLITLIGKHSTCKMFIIITLL